jgi:hypothetical protein
MFGLLAGEMAVSRLSIGDGECGCDQMNAHIKCVPGHIDLSRYVDNHQQEGKIRLTPAELHALEGFYFGLNR